MSLSLNQTQEGTILMWPIYALQAESAISCQKSIIWCSKETPFGITLFQYFRIWHFVSSITSNVYIILQVCCWDVPWHTSLICTSNLSKGNSSSVSCLDLLPRLSTTLINKWNLCVHNILSQYLLKSLQLSHWPVFTLLCLCLRQLLLFSLSSWYVRERIKFKFTVFAFLGCSSNIKRVVRSINRQRTWIACLKRVRASFIYSSQM